MKKCSKCQISKPLDNFNKNRAKRDGLSTECKLCKRQNDAKYRENNANEISVSQKQYRVNNTEKLKERDHKYYIDNKDYVLEQTKKYKQNNEEWYKEYNRQYKEDNKEIIAKHNKEYYETNKDAINKKLKNKYHTNLEYKIALNLRRRITKAINTNQKVGSAVDDLGCSIEFFKNYIQEKFDVGMNWNNYGEWHLDHIMPLASFDLIDRKQFLKACHYTNYQPLWAKDNLSKGAKLGWRK